MENRPDTAEVLNRECKVQTHRRRVPPCPAPARESDGGLRVGVARAALAALECLDAVIPERLYERSHPHIPLEGHGWPC
jgi:hypothetical protein